MLRPLVVLLASCTCAVLANAQVGELSISGGAARIGGGSHGTTGGPTDPAITIDGGFTLGIRFTLNTYRFFGHEFGYAYNRTTVKIPGSGDVGVPVHQAFYDFMVYATPEGTKIRPFACGGVGFASFFPPGTSVYYGNQITKFGINYGGGLKFRINSIWGARVDIRQYNTGQPFEFPSRSGRFLNTQYSVGVSFNF